MLTLFYKRFTTSYLEKKKLRKNKKLELPLEVVY